MRPKAPWYAVAFVLVLGFPASSEARSHLPSDPSYLGLEFALPLYDEETNFSSFSLEFRARSELGKHARVMGALPFVHVSPDGFSSEQAFGNLFLGIEDRRIENHFGVDLGVWLPTASDNDLGTLLVGAVSDLDRWEDYFTEILSGQLGISVWYLGPTGAGIHLRLAPTIWIPVGDNDRDPELFGLYSLRFIYHGRTAEFGAGFLGRHWLSESDFDFSIRNSNQFEIEGNLKAGTSRVGLQIIIPFDGGLNELLGGNENIVDLVFGLQAGVVLQ